MFTWLGAVVDIPHQVYKVLGSLGPTLPEWEQRSTSQEVEQEKINKEVDMLLHDDNISELRDISRLVYGMLRYETGRDRIIPLLKDMGKDFAAMQNQ